MVDGFDDLVDLVAQDEAGQVEHDGGAHAGAYVGGAGGEVAEAGGECVVEGGFEVGIDLVCGVPCFFEAVAWLDALDAQVVFFVEHDAEELVLADDEAATSVFGCVFAGDEVLFDEHLFFDGGEFIHRFVDEAGLHGGELGYGVAYVLE